MFSLALGNGNTLAPASGWIGEWRFLADQQGLSTSIGRTPDADLIPVINDTYRSLREQVTQWGYTQFLTRGATTALPTAAFETGETYSVIDVGTSGSPGTISTTDQIKMIRVKQPTGRWETLTEISPLQLEDESTNIRGYAKYWCWLNAGAITGAAFTKGAIAISPVPVGGSYVIWSMNEFTAASLSTDLFLYHTADWKRWHMLSTLVMVCGIRDKDTARQIDIAQRELDPSIAGTVAARVKDAAPTASGPKTWTRSPNYRGGGLWGQ